MSGEKVQVRCDALGMPLRQTRRKVMKRRLTSDLWYETYIAPVVCFVLGHKPVEKLSCTICKRCRRGL